MDKGKHSKRYPQGSRNSRQSRAHRLEALQETVKPQRQTIFLEAQAAYLSDADILRLFDTVKGIAQRRGIMG